MYAIFSMRKMALIDRINNIQVKLMDITNKLTDLAQFGSSVTDGNITPDELATMPGSFLGATQNFMSQANPMAMSQAQQYGAMIQQMYGGQMNPQMAQYMQQEAYKNALQTVGRQMEKKIAVEETKIQKEKVRLETQLKAAQTELETVEKAEDQGIKQATPKYV